MAQSLSNARRLVLPQRGHNDTDPCVNGMIESFMIAGSLAVDAPQQQALLELETASARLKEETRILNRETELLRDLLVRLRERGERPELN